MSNYVAGLILAYSQTSFQINWTRFQGCDSGRSYLHEPKYPADIYNKYPTGKSNWVCKSCHNSMSKNKMQVQVNNLELLPYIQQVEWTLSNWFNVNFSNHTIYVYCPKTKGVLHGLKRQCFLVPTDLGKIQTILPIHVMKSTCFSCFKRSIDWQECG